MMPTEATPGTAWSRGRIVQSGGPELAHELESKGYDWLRKDYMDEPVNSNGHVGEDTEHDHA